MIFGGYSASENDDLCGKTFKHSKINVNDLYNLFFLKAIFDAFNNLLTRFNDI